MPIRKTDPAAARLRAAAGRLVHRVEHWSAARWAQPAKSPVDLGLRVVDGDQLATLSPRSTEATRADVVQGLVQRLADLSASLEGRPAQAVPRLDNDLALPDQLTVMVSDLALLGASDEVIRAAAADIDATAARL